MEKLKFKDKEFVFIKQRRYDTEYEIYRFRDEILRIGPARIIEFELERQKELEDLGFPIPKFIESGKYEDRSYFIESSLGESHFGEIFSNEIKEKLVISDNTFEKFKSIFASFLNAQINSAIPMSEEIIDNFIKLCHIDDAKAELESENIVLNMKDVIAKLRLEVKSLPAVFTHGDFNPHNIFEKGVIDFEDFTYAPLLYDAVSAIEHINFFPNKGDFEMNAGYKFSKSQKTELENIARDNFMYYDLRLNTFKVARASSAIVRMHHVPKIQAYRFAMYEEIINDYLSDKFINLEKIRENAIRKVAI